MIKLEWIGKDKVINYCPNTIHSIKRKYSYDERGLSYDDNGSENMIIHGNNLDALISLLPKYEGKVKCIYIDPPYNTAKSSDKNKIWIYSDCVDDPKIQKWLNKTVCNEQKDFTKHDKWLCMIYPCLKLLYKLLSQDGIIFISIDDNEQASLKIICDEIFGEKNFIAQLVWKSDGNFDNQSKIKIVHEYILCYSKNQNLLNLPNGIDPNTTKFSKIFKKEIRNSIVKNGSKNPMSIVKLPKGFPCAVNDLTIEQHHNSFPYYHEKAIIKNGKLQNDVNIESGWSSKNILLKFIQNNFEPVLDTKNQITTFEITRTGSIEMVKHRNYISHVLSVISNIGSTRKMSQELSLMGIKFDFPKPTKLIEYLINFYTKDNDIILDSFAGSGSTAHAVLNLNKKDNNNRKFILIEMMDYADTITAKRVKCVISGYGHNEKHVDGIGGDFSYYELE